MPRASGNIFRTTISIPMELKLEMEAAIPDLNWSAIAAEAFRAKIEQSGYPAQKTSTKEQLVALQMQLSQIIYRMDKEHG